jgi:hypothetical protein
MLVPFMKVKVTDNQAMKTYVGVKVELHRPIPLRQIEVIFSLRDLGTLANREVVG